MGLSRRAVLRGAGVSIALPFLEVMAPSGARAQQAGKAPLRFVVLFKPNGSNMQTLVPASTGPGYTLTGSLSPLAPFKDKVLVVSGLQNKIAGPHSNLHLAGMASWLTAVRFANKQAGTSIDQAIAGAIKGSTPFASLELGANTPSIFRSAPAGECDGSTEYPCSTGLSISYVDGRTPKPSEVNPQAAFDRLMSAAGGPVTAPAGGSQTDAAAKRRLYKQSVLDVARAEAERLKAKLGASDKRRLDGYLTSIRDLELRLQPAANPGAPAGPAGAVATPAACPAGARPAAGLAFPARVKAMMDVIALALQCDRTRVVTFMMGEGESDQSYNGIAPGAGSGDHHGLSHHGNRAESLNTLTAVDRWHMEQMAYLVGKLAAMQEPGGSVLDNSLVYHGSELSDGDSHSYVNMTVVLAGRAGGALPAGSHVRVPGERSLGDLYLTFLQMFGVNSASFGNSTGPLSLSG